MTDDAIKNGSGAAAVLATGIGAFVLALLDVVGDHSAKIKSSLVFYRPTGALSGVSTVAIVVWLVVWVGLEWRWRRRDVAMGPVAGIALALLGVSFLLMFPPLGDML